MKQAYVTLLLSFPDFLPTEKEIQEIDRNLSGACLNHEIVLSTTFEPVEKNITYSNLEGPLSIVYTDSMHSQDRARIAALGRAVGDFIIEWQGGLNMLTAEMISKILNPSDLGFELVEIESNLQPKFSRIFYKFVNLLRPPKAPVRKTVGRVISRRATGLLLSASKFEQQVSILFAELPVKRLTISTNVEFLFKQNMQDRIREGVLLLSRGSRFGTVVPLLLASISAFFGVLVATYAFGLYLLNGKSPEGWTTLMVVLGVGQASILALIGLTWSRLDSLAKSLTHGYDATAEVVVIAPTN